ncbi:MAG: hypothetical protein ACI4T2_02675 [Christensenellales bacterium]
MKEKKVYRDRYYIIMSLSNPKVKNMLVLYALENEICQYPVDWIKQVWQTFDQKFVEPRIIDIGDSDSGEYFYFDGKKTKRIGWQVEERDGHKKIYGKILDNDHKHEQDSKGRD